MLDRPCSTSVFLLLHPLLCISSSHAPLSQLIHLSCVAPAGSCTLPWSPLHANPICGPAVFGSSNHIPLLSYHFLASSLPLTAFGYQEKDFISIPLFLSLLIIFWSKQRDEVEFCTQTWANLQLCHLATQKEETLAESSCSVDHRLGQKGIWHCWFCLVVSNVSSL